MSQPMKFLRIVLACLVFGTIYAHAVQPERVQPMLGTSQVGGRRCLPTTQIPTQGLTPAELEILDTLCIDEDALSAPQLIWEKRSGVPPGVSCKVTQWCDSGTCTDVCARGTVTVEPWLANAVRLQARLARSLPLCYSTWFGTHNSAISLSDGYGNLDPVYQALFKYFKWAAPDISHSRLRTNNQWLSLTDQLNLGVRVIEIDAHWFGGVLRVAHCGGLHVEALNVVVRALNTVAKILGRHIRWDTETLGCDPSLSSIPATLQRTVLDALEEIGEWMAAEGNEDEFLVLFFDDQPNLETWGVVGRLLEDIQTVFPRETIFTQDDLRSWGGAWPSADQMIASGRRLLLVSVTDYGPDMAPLIFPRGRDVCGWMEPPLEGIEGAPDCVIARDTTTIHAPRDLYDGSIVRIATCELEYGPLNCEFIWKGSNAPLLDEATLPGVNECGVNIPSPDLLTPSKAQAAVWTWAPGHPFDGAEGATCAVITAEDARWRTTVCEGSSEEGGEREWLPSACRKDVGEPLSSEDQWEIPSPSRSGGGGGVRGDCPEGTYFDVPRHPRENYWLANALRSAGATAAWLPIQGPDWAVTVGDGPVVFTSAWQAEAV